MALLFSAWIVHKNVSFPILIKYRANPIISYEGTVALVEDSKTIKRLDLKFRIQPGFAIEDLQASDTFVKLLERREAIEGGVVVTAELDPTIRKDNVDDIFHFSVKLKDQGSEAFRLLSVQVPVRYADRVTVGPSQPTFSLSKKEIRGRIYIVGERAKEIFSKGEIRLSNGESTVRLTVSNLMDRGNKKAWFAELSFDLQDQAIDFEVGDWNLGVVESATVTWRRKVSFVQD